jgi:alkylhydroperoxidase/carboxymuconolactone decarboxylase family protein YurZ
MVGPHLNAKKIKQRIMLSAKQQKIVAIASYTAISDTFYISLSLHQGLDAGLSINEIKEIFLQLNLYCGFPRGIRGVDIFMQVLAERKGRGIHDNEGTIPSPVGDSRSKYERGEEVQMQLNGMSRETLRFGAMGFIPKIDKQLKEYIFADVYESDLLTYAEREIVTLAALLTMNDVEPQAQFHMNTAFQVGLSKQEIEQIISIIELQFGKVKGDTGRSLLSNVIALRNK